MYEHQRSISPGFQEDRYLPQRTDAFDDERESLQNLYNLKDEITRKMNKRNKGLESEEIDDLLDELTFVQAQIDQLTH